MALVTGDIQNIIVSLTEVGVGLFMLQWTAPKTSNQSVYIRYRKVGDASWIVASANLPVLASGVPAGSPFIVIPSPINGERYEIEAKNSTSFYSTTTNIYIPLQFYSNNYLIGDSPYDVCASQPIQLFSNLPFGVGVTLYYDIEMTDAIAESMVSQNVYGNIYAVSGGVVGAPSSIGCYNGMAGIFVLANTPSLCNDAPVTGYINEYNPQSLTGLILYSDELLETPVTGFTNVMRVDTLDIYEINTVTGEIGEVVGVCASFYNILIQNENSRRIITNVLGIAGFNLVGTVTVGETETGIHTGFTGSIAVVLEGGGNCDNCGVDSVELYVNDVKTQTLKVQDGTYIFTSATYLNTDELKIVLLEDHCDSVPLLMS